MPISLPGIAKPVVHEILCIPLTSMGSSGKAFNGSYSSQSEHKKKYKVKLTNQTNQEKVFVLSIISLFYVSAHFMLFPATWERFFMAQYLFLFMLIGLLFNSSKDIAK